MHSVHCTMNSVINSRRWPARKDLQDRESDVNAHFSIAMDTVQKTGGQCTSLTRECKRLKVQHNIFGAELPTVSIMFRIDKHEE